MNADQVFLIAHRYNHSMRLNHELYMSFDDAKRELCRWEKEDDPRRELLDHSEQAAIRANRRPWNKKPMNHNRRDFEVVDLATHLQNVAAQNYEKAKREKGYFGPANTTWSYIDSLK